MTTNNDNTITNLHKPQIAITTAHTHNLLFVILLSLVVARQQLLRMEIPHGQP
jgi:hypothetical protein